MKGGQSSRHLFTPKTNQNAENVVAQEDQGRDGDARREGEECPSLHRRRFGRFLEREPFEGASGAEMRKEGIGVKMEGTFRSFFKRGFLLLAPLFYIRNDFLI